MHITWADVVLFVKGNRGWLTFNLGLLATSAVKVMPLPGQPKNLYTFLFDWTHQFLNLPNLRLTPGPVITPPENSKPSPDQQPPTIPTT